MFDSIILSFALLAITLTTVHCTECKEHEAKCTSLEELGEEQNCFTTWATQKCPTPETVIDQAEVDKYKNCIKTHLEPCLQAKEDEPFKKIFIDLFNDKDLDLCHVCKNETQAHIEDELFQIYMDHKDAMAAAAEKKCSIIKQAMHDVMVCAKIKHS